VGWAAAGSIGAQRPSFRGLPANVAMRIANVARWIDRNGEIRNEMYRPEERYRVAIFVKAMDAAAQEEAQRVRAAGGKVVFDANVNYYDVWGEYGVPGSRPTEQQQRDARAMTRLADWVVCDSSYLLDVVRHHNENASWIPDNVDTRLFRPARLRRARRPLRLVWSGMAHKADPLLSILEALAALDGAELAVVSNSPPDCLPTLERSITCRFVRFNLRRYARFLRTCDVIVSPKRLVNGYELAHSEWKITLGMGAGLPAVASPQRSYVEAISHRGGGIVADSPGEWAEALGRLSQSAQMRTELGERARRTVLEHYSTPVVARRYLDLLRALA
jgi:glycosyltransferase involved in cell wall biosynthesis